MILHNKYTKWYKNLIRSRRNIERSKNDEEFFETHHIIPRCFGGSDDSKNLILLTPREHFICHLLLTKMVTGSKKRSMVYALVRFVGKNTEKYTACSRIYQYIVEKNRFFTTGKNNPMYGRPWWNDETDPEKIQRWKDSISVGVSGEKNPFFGKLHTENTKKTMSEIAIQRLMDKTKHPMYGKKRAGTLSWINDGKKNKRISKEEVDGFVELGWKKGQLRYESKKH